MIGLKRGTVQLCKHEKEWEIEAQNTIARLKEILGDVIKDIQHVGSTSILTLKVSLALQAPIDSGREKYLRGKHDFIVYTLRKALVKSYLGKTVTFLIDRPVGSVHPKHDDIIYPINYGFIPKVLGSDGEELDVYLLGVDAPIKEYTARIIGIVHRRNDVEDKLVAAPEGMSFSAEEIIEAVKFQEQYYNIKIEILGVTK